MAGPRAVPCRSGPCSASRGERHGGTQGQQPGWLPPSGMIKQLWHNAAFWDFCSTAALQRSLRSGSLRVGSSTAPRDPAQG